MLDRNNLLDRELIRPASLSLSRRASCANTRAVNRTRAHEQCQAKSHSYHLRPQKYPLHEIQARQKPGGQGDFKPNPPDRKRGVSRRQKKLEREAQTEARHERIDGIEREFIV